MKIYQDKQFLNENLIDNDMTYQQVADLAGCTIDTLRKWAKKLGVIRENGRHILDRHGDEIIGLYQQGDMFVEDIAEKFGINYNTVTSFIKREGVKARDRKKVKSMLDERNLCRVYDVNFDYFKNWNSNMAYVLGLISSDGHLTPQNKLEISLKRSDKSLLESIKNDMGYTGAIYDTKTKYQNGYKETCKLGITSKSLAEDLKSLGITSFKTFDCDLPEEIPNEFIIDFIRGYFDGDGSVGFQLPTNKFGVTTKKTQIRSRIFSANPKLLEKIAQHLKDEVGLKQVKVNQTSKNLWAINYSTFDSIKLYHAMYHSDNCISLERKKLKFEEGIALRENT